MTRAQVFGTHRLVAISSFVLLETRNRTDRTNRTEPNRSFIRTCQQTDNKAHSWFFVFRLRSDIRRGWLWRVVRRASFRPDPVRDSTDRRCGTSVYARRMIELKITMRPQSQRVSRNRRRRRRRRRTTRKTSPHSSTNSPHPSRRQLPAIALGAFIIYSIVTVVLSVVFFPSRPSEARALARDVLRARRRLADRGVVLS